MLTQEINVTETHRRVQLFSISNVMGKLMNISWRDSYFVVMQYCYNRNLFFSFSHCTGLQIYGSDVISNVEAIRHTSSDGSHHIHAL